MVALASSRVVAREFSKRAERLGQRGKFDPWSTRRAAAPASAAQPVRSGPSKPGRFVNSASRRGGRGGGQALTLQQETGEREDTLNLCTKTALSHERGEQGGQATRMQEERC